MYIYTHVFVCMYNSQLQRVTELCCKLEFVHTYTGGLCIYSNERICTIGLPVSGLFHFIGQSPTSFSFLKVTGSLWLTITLLWREPSFKPKSSQHRSHFLWQQPLRAVYKTVGFIENVMSKDQNRLLNCRREGKFVKINYGAVVGMGLTL